MKWLFVFLMVLIPAAMGAQTPTPAELKTSVALNAATKKINFRVTWSPQQNVDSTMILVFLSSDTTPSIYRRAKSPDTVAFTIPDDTTTYRFMLVNVRRGLVSLPANANFYFNANAYYREVRLQIRPKPSEVDIGTKLQLCAFVEYNDGSIVMRDRDKTIPTCISEYEKIDATLRKSVGARLRKANTLCFQWQTSTGTVENETCSR